MEKLISELKTKIAIMNKANGNNFNLSDEVLNSLYSVYPFSQLEYIMSCLIATNTMTFREYLDIRNRYLERNKYLYVFEITAPRAFGETWAQQHLNEVVPELQCPSKSYDPNYSGQYDFWYDDIQIEVKASRAVRRGRKGPLITKALSSDSPHGFDMNFQQMKPACCDVFVWIAVWSDIIRYWVLSSDEVKNNRYYSSGQHRGNVGEGQLWLTDTNISEFNIYEVGASGILSKIIEKGKQKAI